MKMFNHSISLPRVTRLLLWCDGCALSDSRDDTGQTFMTQLISPFVVHVCASGCSNPSAGDKPCHCPCQICAGACKFLLFLARRAAERCKGVERKKPIDRRQCESRWCHKQEWLCSHTHTH